MLQELVHEIRQLAIAGSLSMTAASVLARLTPDGPHRSTDLAKLECAA